MSVALDYVVVAFAVIASASYVVYALGSKSLRDRYSRFATKVFGLRAARWFAGNAHAHSCSNCPSNTHGAVQSSVPKKIS